MLRTTLRPPVLNRTPTTYKNHDRRKLESGRVAVRTVENENVDSLEHATRTLWVDGRAAPTTLSRHHGTDDIWKLLNLDRATIGKGNDLIPYNKHAVVHFEQPLGCASYVCRPAPILVGKRASIDGSKHKTHTHTHAHFALI